MALDKGDEHAADLLADWAACKHAKPRVNAAAVQITKDQLEQQAKQLGWVMVWDKTKLNEHCRRFKHDLSKYKKKVVLEILQHGSV